MAHGKRPRRATSLAVLGLAVLLLVGCSTAGDREASRLDRLRREIASPSGSDRTMTAVIELLACDRTSVAVYERAVFPTDEAARGRDCWRRDGAFRVHVFPSKVERATFVDRMEQSLGEGAPGQSGERSAVIGGAWVVYADSLSAAKYVESRLSGSVKSIATPYSYFLPTTTLAR